MYISCSQIVQTPVRLYILEEEHYPRKGNSVIKEIRAEKCGALNGVGGLAQNLSVFSTQ